MKLGVRDKIFHTEMHTKTVQLHYVSERCWALTVKKEIHETAFTQKHIRVQVNKKCLLSVAFAN